MARDVKSVIEEMRAALDADEGEYRRAIEFINNPESVKKYFISIREKMLPIMTFNANEQPPHAAVAVLSWMQERFGGLFQDLAFIEEYEERKEEYKAHVKTHVGIEDKPGTTE